MDRSWVSLKDKDVYEQRKKWGRTEMRSDGSFICIWRDLGNEHTFGCGYYAGCHLIRVAYFSREPAAPVQLGFQS